jgi:hypothetical protein
MNKRTNVNNPERNSESTVARCQDKELRLFELKYGSFDDLAELSFVDKCNTLESLLRRIFIESAISVASSIKWQAVYLLGYHMCVKERCDQDVYSIVEKALEEGAEEASQLTAISKAFATYFSPQTRVHFLFVTWVLNQVPFGRCIPAEIKSKIFSFTICFDIGRGRHAVLDTWSHLRAWNRYKVSGCLGDELIASIGQSNNHVQHLMEIVKYLDLKDIEEAYQQKIISVLAERRSSK